MEYIYEENKLFYSFCFNEWMASQQKVNI
jgi:hypothetical protein